MKNKRIKGLLALSVFSASFLISGISSSAFHTPRPVPTSRPTPTPIVNPIGQGGGGSTSPSGPVFGISRVTLTRLRSSGVNTSNIVQTAFKSGFNTVRIGK